MFTRGVLEGTGFFPVNSTGAFFSTGLSSLVSWIAATSACKSWNEGMVVAADAFFGSTGFSITGSGKLATFGTTGFTAGWTNRGFCSIVSLGALAIGTASGLFGDAASAAGSWWVPRLSCWVLKSCAKVRNFGCSFLGASAIAISMSWNAPRCG